MCDEVTLPSGSDLAKHLTFCLLCIVMVYGPRDETGDQNILDRHKYERWRGIPRNKDSLDIFMQVNGTASFKICRRQPKVKPRDTLFNYIKEEIIMSIAYALL